MHKSTEMENCGSDALHFPYYCKVKVNIIGAFITIGSCSTHDVLFFPFFLWIHRI